MTQYLVTCRILSKNNCVAFCNAFPKTELSPAREENTLPTHHDQLSLWNKSCWDCFISIPNWRLLTIIPLPIKIKLMRPKLTRPTRPMKPIRLTSWRADEADGPMRPVWPMMLMRLMMLRLPRPMRLTKRKPMWPTRPTRLTRLRHIKPMRPLWSMRPLMLLMPLRLTRLIWPTRMRLTKLLRPKAMVRPKAMIRPKAKLRLNAKLRPKAMDRPKAKFRPKANNGKLFLLIALMMALPSFLIIRFFHSPSQNILQSLQKWRDILEYLDLTINWEGPTKLLVWPTWPMSSTSSMGPTRPMWLSK